MRLRSLGGAKGGASCSSSSLQKAEPGPSDVENRLVSTAAARAELKPGHGLPFMTTNNFFFFFFFDKTTSTDDGDDPMTRERV